ncbi:uncharacterized protein KY384_005161 [Bacidia gigantensis]|uniref:uncharacterized protein n=1 Tax=Bacidia gigantensis TaxID=2732470 RepID=UPI001D052A9A|nr:uncharacterized protein KY384_005161 [Bacidia gigantensis]KAG8529680.1 hypothetical protein KY384_005161 [Bacidia gigantensis]
MLPVISFDEIAYETAHYHESRQVSIVAGISILYGVTVIVVLLRMISRRIQGLKLGWDDYTIALGTIITGSMCGIILQAVRLGLGKHILAAGKTKAIKVARLLYVFEVVYPVILNVATLALPLPLVWKLKLSPKKKLGVALLVRLNLFTSDVAICIVRTVVTRNITTSKVDFTWFQVENTVLAVTEVMIGIVCACIPTLRPVILRVRSSFSRPSKPSEPGESEWTVPFVMLFSKKSRPTSSSGQTALLGSGWYGDEKPEKNPSLPKDAKENIEKHRGHAEGEQAITTQSPTLNLSGNWKGSHSVSPVVPSACPSPLIIQRSHKSVRSSIKSMIGRNLVHSGYPDDAYCRLMEPRSRPCPQEPLPSLPPLVSPVATDRNMAFMTRMSGLSLDTSPAMLQQAVYGASHPPSPRSKQTSPTLIGNPTSAETTKYKNSTIRTPTTSLDTAVERSPDIPCGLRRPGQTLPTIPSSDNLPRSSQLTTSPTSRQGSKGRKAPRYVRSPLMDPENKIRQGSPRMVAIKTPTRGQSLKSSASLRNAGWEGAKPPMPGGGVAEKQVRYHDDVKRPVRAMTKMVNDKPLPEPPPWWEEG